jgi:hypothetical protein
LCDNVVGGDRKVVFEPRGVHRPDSLQPAGIRLDISEEEDLQRQGDRHLGAAVEAIFVRQGMEDRGHRIGAAPGRHGERLLQTKTFRRPRHLYGTHVGASDIYANASFRHALCLTRVQRESTGASDPCYNSRY